MKFKKVLLPLITGALALSLAACGEDDKAVKDENPEKAAQEEMQAKLAEQQVEKDKIVAIVNDEKLKGEQYNATLTSIQGQMQQMGQDPSSKESAEQAKRQALDMVVNQTLILQKAKEAKITASESEIDEKYAEFVGQFGDEETMKEALKSQNVDVRTVKEQIIAKSIIFEKYQDKCTPVEKVTEKEIKKYYDQAAAQSKDSGQELPPLEEVSDEIKAMIEEEQQQKQLTAHVEELKADAEIDLKI